MTNSLNNSDELPSLRTGVPLTASDAERIATAIEAELAPSTRRTYAVAWRVWERWCRGRGVNPLPAPPEALLTAALVSLLGLPSAGPSGRGVLGQAMSQRQAGENGVERADDRKIA
jgi:hypothetical protein